MLDFFNKIRNKINSMECPTEYYICHALFALVIAAAVSPILGVNAGLVAGATFYIGREYTQWESGLEFDWKGLLSPLITCLVLLIAYNFYISVV